VQYWLLKTEPEEYRYSDLVRDGVAEWDGITAAPAQANLRKMVVGDTCVIYHTGNERQATGIASVERPPYPDPTDPAGKRIWVDVRAVDALPSPVSLAALKAHPAFADSQLVRMSRLSVVPLSEEQYRELIRLGGGKA
jgi:predicted RNA-binding protein with PUA-like domain